MNAALALALLIPVTYAAMVCYEVGLGRGQRWPAVRGWQLAGVGAFALMGVVNALVALLIAPVFGHAFLFDGRALGGVGGGLAAFALLSLGNALLHRAYHRSDWLWRWVHQLHHAPPRLGVAGVMLQSPLEMAASAALFSFVTVLVLRVDPTAVAACAWLAAFYGMFQHFDIATPRWLGYLIQRPESHCEHHRRGVHAGNYSDLPLWDLLAGSFRNPLRFEGELGFAPDAARRVGAMLCGRAVESDPRADAAESATEAGFRTRLLVAAWALTWIPTVAHAYGAWHFLQLCNLSLLLALVGFWRGDRLLLSAQAVASLGIGVLFVADVAWLQRGTGYLWDAQIPLAARVLSIYHVLLPLLLLAWLRRAGYDARGFGLAVAVAALALVVAATLAPSHTNLNYVLRWPGATSDAESPLVHAAFSWATLVVLLYWPADRLLARLCARRRHTPSHGSLEGSAAWH